MMKSRALPKQSNSFQMCGVFAPRLPPWRGAIRLRGLRSMAIPSRFATWAAIVLRILTGWRMHCRSKPWQFPFRAERRASTFLFLRLLLQTPPPTLLTLPPSSTPEDTSPSRLKPCTSPPTPKPPPPSLLNPRRYIPITPESVHSGGKPNAPLVFASISSSPTHGAFLVAWNDQFLAADYDMDVVGFLRYDLIRNVNSPSGWDIRVRTDISNLCSSLGGTYGFSIIGVQKRDAANDLVNADGRYLTHQHGNADGEEYEGQIYWDDYTEAWGQLRDMPPTSQYLCGDASYRRKTLLTDASVDYAHSVCYVADNYCEARNMDYFHDETFHVAGEANALIKEPLWYVG